MRKREEIISVNKINEIERKGIMKAKGNGILVLGEEALVKDYAEKQSWGEAYLIPVEYFDSRSVEDLYDFFKRFVKYASENIEICIIFTNEAKLYNFIAVLSQMVPLKRVVWNEEPDEPWIRELIAIWGKNTGLERRRKKDSLFACLIMLLLLVAIFLFLSFVEPNSIDRAAIACVVSAWIASTFILFGD